ncbi:unnamed protein product [Diatraea saccharalis]|uniref:Uncharacterized protein n=1 Tax=Diatraea saccharalis TaxID=40085 RepID=A0A9N9RAQ0_9NEOP|nr:unnamed protein product [Diatraea saccharalis]
MSRYQTFYLIIILCIVVARYECVYVYSSFWAPLFNPRILNYKVDSTFDPEAGKKYRESYVKNYGVRGEKLIVDLGNGKGPSDVPLDKDIGAVKFYFTYPGAQQDNAVNNHDH